MKRFHPPPQLKIDMFSTSMASCRRRGRRNQRRNLATLRWLEFNVFMLIVFFR